jgi:hypothetical protein
MILISCQSLVQEYSGESKLSQDHPVDPPVTIIAQLGHLDCLSALLSKEIKGGRRGIFISLRSIYRTISILISVTFTHTHR